MRALLCLALLGCADTTAPAPSPQARVADAAAVLTRAVADAERAGYQVLINVTAPDSGPARVGVILLPR